MSSLKSIFVTIYFTLDTIYFTLPVLIIDPLIKSEDDKEAIMNLPENYFDQNIVYYFGVLMGLITSLYLILKFRTYEQFRDYRRQVDVVIVFIFLILITWTFVSLSYFESRSGFLNSTWCNITKLEMCDI